MVEYFQGVWVLKLKFCMGSEKGVFCYVLKQLFYYELCENNYDGFDRSYNVRKVNELLYYLFNLQ